MTTVLDKVTLHDVRMEPFPHLVIRNAVEPALADQLLAAYPSLATITQGRPYTSNQRFSLSAAHLEGVSPLWRDFVAAHVTPAFARRVTDLFGLPPFKNVATRGVGEGDLVLDAQICINTPVSKPSSVKGPHLDNERELFAGLWYLRPKDDDSKGGELDIYRIIKRPKFHGARLTDYRFVQKVTTVPYEHNTLVLFLNSDRALHGVTPRQATDRPRYLFNLLGEVPHKLFDLSSQRENLWDIFLRHVRH